MAVDLLHSMTLMPTSRIRAPTRKAYLVSKSMMRIGSDTDLAHYQLIADLLVKSSLERVYGCTGSQYCE